MGIIRPTDDRGDRWALALADVPDRLVVGTADAVHALADVLPVPYVIYSRQTRYDEWRLAR